MDRGKFMNYKDVYDYDDKIVVGGRSGMICASADAESHIYEAHKGKSGKVWLVPKNTVNPAENIYVEGDKGSQGFGGREITFPLNDDGSLKVTLVGPWHSNVEALLEDTGVDIRDRFLTQGVIALKRECLEGMRYRFTGILHIDIEPTLGTFERVKELAQKIVDERGHSVAFYSESRGGSHCAVIEPITEEKGKGNGSNDS